jgi:hypothetical protein
VTAPGPRLLVVMGSGETSPSMVGTHRAVAARFPPPLSAVLLDTPYGFQENAADISARARDYFARRVGLAVDVVGFPGPLAADPACRAARPEPAALARLQAARLVFAGPGSPSYALSVWRGSPIAEALRAKLSGGGAVVLASAAALTLGRFTLPVYEIYKGGHAPRWLDGLDLLGGTPLGTGWAVIPHYDNAEGGTHDTRHCYMGARRLAELEAQLPDDGAILGVDEHTALVVDFEAGQVDVSGRGGVTARRQGRDVRLASGTRLTLAELVAAGRSPGRDRGGATAAGLTDGGPAAGVGPGDPGPGPAPLLDEVARLEAAFSSAVGAGRAGEASSVILALDQAIAEWSSDTRESDEPDRARAVLHALIHRLGEAATSRPEGEATPAPLVERLVALRADLRASGAFGTADRLRDALASAGIDLRDTPAGTTWHRA